MSIKVNSLDPIVEKAARKLLGIEGVPSEEQTRMVRRALRVVADEVSRLRAALTEKDAEIERMRSSLRIIISMCAADDGTFPVIAGEARMALVGDAPEQTPETCVWEFTPCGWHQGCSTGTDTLAEVTEYCPGCGKRVEVRG